MHRTITETLKDGDRTHTGTSSGGSSVWSLLVLLVSLVQSLFVVDLDAPLCTCHTGSMFSFLLSSPSLTGPCYSSSVHQEAPPVKFQPGLLPPGQRSQYGVCVGCHLWGLWTRAGWWRVPLHGVCLPGDLWDHPLNTPLPLGQSFVAAPLRFHHISFLAASDNFPSPCTVGTPSPQTMP